MTPLTTLFVLPDNNAIPTTGSTQDLVASKFGVFGPDHAPATNGDIASDPYVYFAQGRPTAIPGVGSKKSDKIYVAGKLEWYKVPAVTSATNQITVIGNLGDDEDTTELCGKCGETWTVTLRLFSSYVELSHFNGLTKSFTYVSECCDDPSNPTDIDQEAMVDWFVDAINDDVIISKYITAAKTEGTVEAVDYFGISLTGKALDAYGQPCDITAFPHQYDKLRFDTFMYKGAATTQDFTSVIDRCECQQTITVTQKSSYPTGSGKEIKKLEQRYLSYQTTHKHLFVNSNYNGAYVSEVDEDLFYDTYYLKIQDPENAAHFWGDYVNQTETIILAIPVGDSLPTLISTFLGAPTSIDV